MRRMKRKMPVDLRSDTVTRPGREMRRAMADAAVGDDVFGEDPSVNRLQKMAAGITGKESALFMPSGTMSNQVAIKAHTHHGQSVVVGEGSHSYLLESGAVSAISGVVPMVAGRGGTFTKEEMLDVVMTGNIHNPATALVMIENTHNRGGGVIFPLSDIEDICREARKLRLKSHLDGARVFSAAVALGIDVKKIAKNFDSMSFCLSKGLGAPVGSLLCGTKDFIKAALRVRKMLGGGMRQAGILAAAGIWALEHNIDRLADDHQRAARLARALSELPGVSVDLSKVQTNIIVFRVTKGRARLTAPELVAAMKAEGVLMLSVGKDSIRLVTHLDVDDRGIDHAVKAFRKVLA
jgi:threonine aldolase